MAGAPGLPLAGLDTGEVAALIAVVAGPVPPAELADAVRRRCGGNPFFVRELTRLMVAHGDISAEVRPMPDGVRDTLRMRLVRLSRPCLDLLETAAVAGPVVTLPLLVAVGPDDPAAVTDRLEEAERARVLVANGTTWRFSHELYRECVLGLLPAQRLAQLHGAVGCALQRLSGDGTDPAAIGGAARLAAHFVAAGEPAVDAALRWSVLAAREATARLGHADAAGHYTTALGLLRSNDPRQRTELLVQLAAARFRQGDPDAARETYLRAADLVRTFPDPVAFSEVALGVAALGARSGTDDPIGIGLLEEAASQPCAPTPRSRVLAALARALRHGRVGELDPRAASAADEAVELARASGDARSVADALHARHDVLWTPGAAVARLAVLDDMAAAARAARDPELEAEAVLLRAAALIERGDPAGPIELDRYTRVADRLGHARGRWGAMSRRATLAQLAGRVDEAVESSDRALALGTAIGLPDAVGVFSTLRWSLAAIGGPQPTGLAMLPADDPLWPLRPLLAAWIQVQSGDLDGAVASMRGFSVQAIPVKYDLEVVAIATVVLAAVGADEQREWAYRSFLPHAGLHAVVGGCAAYHGVVDHGLGLLATALGRTDEAVAHFTAAVALQERLGAAAWAELSRHELTRLTTSGSTDDRATFRFTDSLWQLDFAGHRAQLPGAKGLRDISMLLTSPGRPVHVFTLLGRDAPATGSDAILDRRAVATFRARLSALTMQIDAAQDRDDALAVERARAERDAVVRELRSSTGLGGRARRLGDETERARKTVTARIREAMRRIDRVHPALGRHLRDSIHTGTRCAYLPDSPQTWRV